MIQGIIVSVNSVYVPQYDVDNGLRGITSMIVLLVFLALTTANWQIVITWNFNSNVLSGTEDCEDQCGDYGFRVRYKDGAIMNMSVGNILFKKRQSNLAILPVWPIKNAHGLWFH